VDKREFGHCLSSEAKKHTEFRGMDLSPSSDGKIGEEEITLVEAVAPLID